MARYIDADLLISELRALNEQERLECMGVYDCIKSAPTADVQEEAVKEFSKLLIDKTNGGKISSTDILDFTVDYLRGENND